jgi:hypothetical protein
MSVSASGGNAQSASRVSDRERLGKVPPDSFIPQRASTAFSLKRLQARLSASTPPRRVALPDGRAGRRESLPRIEEVVMNKRKSLFRELDEAMSQLMRVVESEESGLVGDGRVRLAAQELKKSRKGGQIDADRVIRAATLICEAACDKLLK